MFKFTQSVAMATAHNGVPTLPQGVRSAIGAKMLSPEKEGALKEDLRKP